jgi:hypothetical protein
MRAAIAEIQDRANGTPGLSVSDRINAADLIERGEPAAKVPESATPPQPAPIAAIPPKPTPVAEEKGPAEEPRTNLRTPAVAVTGTPEWLLWAGAITALASIATLIVFWKRRD